MSQDLHLKASGFVPGGGIEFPCEYVLYGAKKDREIVRQTLQKVQKSRKRKRED